ncbi:MAG TPA: hypothetical protein VNL17_16530 [Verrucomicrobiae bacterium]|nr:hypothetical protein [Verrucomicrobiae bacterium]
MQSSKIQRVTILSVMLFASVILVHAALEDGSKLLDGTKWKIKAIPDKATADKGGKEIEDEWVFADGKFTSTTMAREGFKPATYRLETEPGEIEFEIEQNKAIAVTNDVVIWTATIKGTNATGGLQWKKKVNGDFIYDVIGTRK